MTTQPVPLLTAEQAHEVWFQAHPNNRAALDAIADGRTACVSAERLAELERDAARMRWLQRMAAYVGFSADPWLVDPTRIDGAIEDENRPARAKEGK